jgi:hypothetical protein
MGYSGSEVSPHRDAEDKIGTHIFYFNRSADWSPEWGGETLVLAGKRVPTLNPDFSDFDQQVAIPILDNASFLFKNEPDAWHGVRPLHAPEGHYRRLFNVIVTHRKTPKSKTRAPQSKKLIRRVLETFRSQD